MSTELTTQEQNYTNEQIELIKSMYAKGTTNDELQLLMYMSQKYELDILTKQIWCVKFGSGPAQIYAGRDGFLEIAHKSGMFNGMDTKIIKIDEPIDIQYKNYGKPAHFKSEYQFVATCTVYRKDMEHPITVEVYEEEYSTGQNLWQTKRRTMIGKVAESQALRKAFSINGLYSPEEMGQWEQEQNPEPQKPQEPMVDQNHIKALCALNHTKGFTDDQLKKSLKKAYEITSKKQLTIKQFKEVMKKLESLPDKVEEKEEVVDAEYTEVEAPKGENDGNSEEDRK